MRLLNSQWNKVLDFVFSVPSHLAVLRALYAYQNGLSGRECARKASINHQACNLALDRLVGIGLVYRKGYGRSPLYFINKENAILNDAIIPLLEAELKIGKQFKEDLKKLYLPSALSIIIFGSQAKGVAKIGSDLDICFIGRNERAKKIYSQEFFFHFPWFKSKYGFTMNPLFFTQEEIRTLNKQKNVLLANMMSEGEVIYGKQIEELIDDKKNKQKGRKSTKK